MKTPVCNLCLLTVLAVSSVLAAETEIGVEDDALHTVPRGVRDATGFSESRGLAGEKCDLVGKRIDLHDPSKKLWFATDTCGGSGGQVIYVVYENPKPTMILDAGTSLELKVLDVESHGLPDLIVVSGGNCCGMSSDTYRFDGNQYRSTAHGWKGEFDRLGGDQIPVGVAAVVYDDGAKKGCVLSANQITGSKEARVALLVVSSCESEDVYSLWVVMVSPAPHVILRDQSANQVSIGPDQSFGQPDLCFAAINSGDQDRCWRFDGKVYLRR